MNLVDRQMNSWRINNSEQRLIPAFSMVFFCTICHACSRESGEEESFLANQTSAVSHREYSEACIRKLGPIPPLNCRDAEPLNVGLKLSDVQIAELSHEVRQALQCDTPLMGFNNDTDVCAPGSRLLATRSESGTIWSLNCGQPWKYWTVHGSQNFDTVQAIGRADDGSTCFFKLNQPNPFTSAEPVRLDSSEEVWNTWLDAQFPYDPTHTALQCMQCHNASAFRWTQAIRKSAAYRYRPLVNKEFVPLMVTDEMITAWPDYRPRRLKSSIETSSSNGGPCQNSERNLCTSCHVLGKVSSGQGFQSFADAFVTNGVKAGWHEEIPEYISAKNNNPEGMARSKKAYLDCIDDPIDEKFCWEPVPLTPK